MYIRYQNHFNNAPKWTNSCSVRVIEFPKIDQIWNFHQVDPRISYCKLDIKNHCNNYPKWERCSSTAITKGKTLVLGLLTEVKHCWTGLLSGWVTIWIKYPVLYFLGSQAGVVKTSITPSTSTTNVVCGLSFSRSQPDFEGFLRALRFPPSAKSTRSLINLAVEGRKLDNCLG